MLKIAVCLKQIPDPLSVEINPLSGAINTDRLVYIANPADMGALEVALRWREQSGGGEVHVLCGGPERAEVVLREALALGANSVMRLWQPELANGSPAITARALANAIEPLGVDLVLCGSRSLDRASGQVPGRLAELLQLAQATGVVEAELEPGSQQIEVKRKLERGRREALLVPLPALLAFEPDVAQPRYASLPALMMAQQATIPLAWAQLERTGKSQEARLIETRLPRPRPRQIFIPDPDLPAAARIQAILNGGAATSGKKAGPLEGSAEQQAERILAFLEQRGFLEGQKSEG